MKDIYGFFCGYKDFIADLDTGNLFYVTEEMIAVLMKHRIPKDERIELKHKIINDLDMPGYVLPLFCGSVERSGVILDFDGFTGCWEY